MFNTNFIWTIYILIVLIPGAGCTESAKTKISDCLNVKMPDDSKDFEYYNYTLTEYYRKPYNIYIRFKVNSKGFEDIIRQTKLISYESDFKKYLCLEGSDKFLINKLWNFNFIAKAKNEISWWDQINSKNIVWYSSFYKENGINKIVNCSNNDWDGYILLGYSHRTGDIYISIRVLMKT